MVQKLFLLILVLESPLQVIHLSHCIIVLTIYNNLCKATIASYTWQHSLLRCYMAVDSLILP